MYKNVKKGKTLEPLGQASYKNVMHIYSSKGSCLVSFI